MPPTPSRTQTLLSWLALVLIGTLVAAAFIRQSLLPWPVIAFAVFVLLEGLSTRRWWVATPLDVPILVLLGMLPVTLWATPLPDVTLPQVWRVLNGVVLYYVVVRWCTTPERLRLGLYGALLIGVGLAAFAPFSVTWSVSKLPFVPAGVYQRFSLLVADTVHPNVMGGNLAMFLPLAAALLLFDGRDTPRWQSLLVVFAGISMGVMLVLTKSRGAWMGVALVLGLLVIMRWRRWGLLAGGIVVGALVLGMQYTSLDWKTVLDLLSSNGAASGFDGRMDIWSRAVYMLQDFPFTGVGMGTFGPVADLLYPFFLAAPGKVVHAHNLFLQIGADLGIPGLIAWLACWLGVIWMGWRVYRQTGAGLLRAAGVGVLLSQVVIAVHGIFDAVVWGQIRAAPLLWLVWALGAAALRLTAAERKG